ncbi:SusC/RagA family TonB-linked outer membrane protein [Mucilaginibacter ximonensis]|uniref:SusC/RagA family TonB-linked outer membrane protein n=1 Tax=Mucilaginibacter ximonensis TaxID=538021 RepID=A0ABW5YBX5_9SPHI
MRLTTLLLCVCLMQVSASTLAQKITLSVKNASLSKVIKEIKVQANVDFFISSNLLKQNKNITLDVKGMDLTTALDLIFKDLPLIYTIEDKFVVITEKKQLLIRNVSKEERDIKVSGRLVDAKGKAINGATVSVKGKSQSAVSGADGRFTISIVDENSILVISHIGFKTKEVALGELTHDIVLEEFVSPLDEVHVIGYGTESRRFSVGAVSSVSASDIENQPVTNPLAALEGLVPGLNITPSSGAPGAAIRVQIRGQNSLSQTGFGSKPYDQPLFVIDGVPAAAQNININALNAFGGGDGTEGNFGGISPFNSLNPADIESISILKDVSATAIYGTQGANGVILITTKKGKAGKAQVRADFNTGFNSPTRKIRLLNREQYLDYRRESAKNDNVDLTKVSPLAYPDLLLFDQNKNTDWVDYYLGKNTVNTNAHLSLSGGSEKTTYLISTGFTNSQYNFPGDFADKRLTLHSNLNYATPDNRFNISFGSDFSYERNNTAATTSLIQAILTPPNFPDLYDAAGNPNWNYKGYNTSQFVQYAASLKQPSILRSYNLINSMTLSYRIISDLKISVNLGYNRIASDEDQRLPSSTINPRLGAVSMANFTKNTFETINIEPQLNYQHSFGPGVFNALLGGTYKNNNISEVQLNGSGFSDEALLGSIGSAATILATDSYNPYKYVGAFARLGYTYDMKYIIQLAGRRDGSSNFGPGRQFANFGSVALGWIFSEETFFKNAIPVISYGKLSGSYGTVGTDVTTPYQYQQLFAGDNSGQNFQGTRPLYVQNPYNPDYGWDTKKSINLGLDLGFIKDRILLNVNYYRDRIGNQLVNYTLPSQTGFNAVLSNFAAVVQNKGIEVNLTSKNIIGKKFSWSTSFNISANSNKLIAFPGLEQSSYGAIYSIGESVNTVKGYGLAGVNPQTGYYQFYKSDGSITDYPNYGSPSFGGDFRAIANTDPKFIGGLGNTISYKQFSFYFQFQFQRKQQANYLRSLYLNARPGTLSNQPVEILDHWKQPGDNSSIQRLTRDFNLAEYYFTTSSGAYSDGSYVRLRTAAISYVLPAGICKVLGIADGKFYISGQNLLLLTKYKVGDPELADIFSFPIQRTLNFGFNINL